MKTTEKRKPSVKCADCLFARQFKQANAATGRYVLKVKCAKGHWQKGKSDGSCDLHHILRRRTSRCPDFLSTSENENDREQFLTDLAESLPDERIVYEADGDESDAWETIP